MSSRNDGKIYKNTMNIIVKIQQDLKDEVTKLNNLIISCLKSDEELIEKV
ncbi:MAG: polyprenyl synthetase family protein, partial [Rickettsia aeschlimannii]